MTKSKRKCIVCGINPPDVPDRNVMPGRPIKRVCKDCHGKRLYNDLLIGVNDYYKRYMCSG